MTGLNSPTTSNSDRTLIVAVIGLVGALGAAYIANVDKWREGVPPATGRVSNGQNSSAPERPHLDNGRPADQRLNAEPIRPPIHSDIARAVTEASEALYQAGREVNGSALASFYEGDDLAQAQAKIEELRSIGASAVYTLHSREFKSISTDSDERTATAVIAEVTSLKLYRQDGCMGYRNKGSTSTIHLRRRGDRWLIQRTENWSERPRYEPC